MNYRSINDLNNTILKQLHLIPRDIDLVVGVPRSGMLPANLLALYLNLPYTDIHSFMKGFIYKSGARKQFFNEIEISNEIDLIYFDAFAPTHQSEMWEVGIFEKLLLLMNSGGLLVSYCAQGQFKRNLKTAGFNVETRPGPPGKREMTVAYKL